jgi:hypothetical protein
LEAKALVLQQRDNALTREIGELNTLKEQDYQLKETTARLQSKQASLQKDKENHDRQLRSTSKVLAVWSLVGSESSAL